MAREHSPLAPRRAKLRPPRIAGDVIARPRLVAQLNRLSLLSLVTAPAGYGKTTLISLWLAQSTLPYAWISLDEEDNAPASFLLDMVTALRTVDPGFGTELLSLLNAPSEPPFELLAGLLANELDTIAYDFMLVLDDYHVIQDPIIHRFVVELVSRPPRRIHVVIASRHDPPLPQHLRVRSAACEIRAQELSFTPAETSAFLSKILDRPVDEGEASAVALQSEGWVASVRLMGLYVRHQPHASLRFEPWRDSARQVLDYLSAAVLDQLPEDVRTFLIRTSILERMCGPLCDAVLGEGSGNGRSAVLLQQLVDDGIFTTALDEEGTWYRYHALFSRALQRMLANRYAREEIAQLHVRAGAWYEQRDLLEEALHHILAAERIADAVALVGRHRHRLMDGYQLRRLERLLPMFPPAALADEIELLLTRTWVMTWRFDLSEVGRLLKQVETQLAELSADLPQVSEWRAEAAALKCQHDVVIMGDAEGAIRAGEFALATLPSDALYTSYFTLLHLGLALQMAGDLASAYALYEAPAAPLAIPRDLALMASVQNRLHLHFAAADLYLLRTHFAVMLEIATARSLLTTVGWAHYFGGCAAYLGNDLEGAAVHFRKVMNLRYHAHAGCFTHSTIGLALTYQAQGRAEEALDLVEATAAYLAEIKNFTMAQMLDAFAAELAARQGRVDEALRWYAREANGLPHNLIPLLYVPGLAPVRVLLAAGTPSSCAEALARLAPLATTAARIHNVYVQIETSALAAALHAATGDQVQALNDLGHALALAEPGGIVRVFVDLAANLAPLFAELARDGASTIFAVHVRNLVDYECTRDSNVPSAHSLANLPAGKTAPPAVPDPDQLLTFREVDVLLLLEQRLTNKEIGERLGITTDTVKQHTVNLFRKLQVENRRQAILAGRARGYLNGG
jgi:LuxR family maltose regulon positive regulatory protein